MKKIIVLAAVMSACAFAPARAQDQGDPNPPSLQPPAPPTKPAIAQQSTPTPSAATPSQSGDTSGPAVGEPVVPSTVVEKDNPNIPDVNNADVSGPSGTSAGAPGIEGKRGAQSGKEWLPPEEIRGKMPRR